MTLERRLRQHFDTVGAELGEPEADLQRVMQRGRRRRSVQQAAVAAATLSIGVVAVLGFQGMSRSNVEFAPAAPPTATTSPTPQPSVTPSPTPEPTVAPSSTPRPSQSAKAPPPVVESIDPRKLGATVMAYGPGDDGLFLIDSAGADLTWPEPVTAAFPDTRSGLVLQTRSGDVVWEPLHGSTERRLDYVTDPAAAGKTDLTLRGVDPDGSILFSTRPAKRYDESITERFFAVPLDGAAGPELVATEGAYESWSVGPAPVVDGHVIASCHLLCSLYRWPDDDDTFPFPDAVYDGGGKGGPNAAIEGLTATPDRTLLAFVEDNDMLDQVPDLVVLDGATFKERLRLPLPVGKNTGIGGAVVSPSSDGQRILVSIDPPRQEMEPVPRTTYLVDDALTPEPVVRGVDFRGVVRWLDPVLVQRK